MRRSSLYTSAVLHGIIFVVAVVGLPLWAKREFVIPPPITVDLIDMAEVTQTNKVLPKPEPPKPEEEKPKPVTPQNAAPEPAPPVKEAPKEEEKKDAKPSKTKEIDELAPVEKTKKKAEPKKEPPKKEPQRDFSSVLKNLDVSKQPPPAPAPGQNAPIGEKMTMSEEDALRAQLEKCWNVPFGAKDAEDLSVDIYMVVNPNRTLREARIVDTARYNSDTFFRAAADSALRAVRNPSCSPFALPPDKYNTWSTITVTFNPKDMF